MRSGANRRRGGRAALWLVVGLLVGGLIGAGATYLVNRGKAGLPGGPRLGAADELDLVPSNAAGFVHIRLRGVWNTEAFSEVRKIVDQAGPQARAAIDQGFVPTPSSIDRMTLVFLKTTDPAKANTAPPGRFQPVPPKGGFPPPPQVKGGFQPDPPPPPRGGFQPGGFPDLDGFIPPMATEDMKVVVILAFKDAFKEEQVRANHLPDGAKKNHAGKDYWEDADLAAYYPSDTVIVLADPAGMKAYLTKLAQGGAGPLSAAVGHARDGGRHVVAAVNVSQFGINSNMFDKMTDGAPEEFKGVAKDAQTVLKLECLSVGVAVVGEETKIDIRAKYKDDAAAADAEEAMRNLAKFARTKLNEQPFKKDLQAAIDGKPGDAKPRPIKELPEAVAALFGLGGLNSVDEWLADPPLSRDGSEVVLTPKLPSANATYAGMIAVSAGLMLPAVEKVRVSASRMKDQNNLKQLGLAMHNYHDFNQTLPLPAFTLPAGGPPKAGGLSWRVHMLPHIEQEALYKEFKLDEPWDSPNNKKLIDRMPVTFASPLVADPAGQTRYKVFVGNGAAFERGQKFSLVAFADGTSNTIMIVGGGQPVVWTKPDDIEFTGTIVPSALALPGKTGCNVTMGDGSVRWIELGRVRPENLKAAITRAGGEVIGLDW